MTSALPDGLKVPPNCEDFFTPDPDGGAPEFWIDGYYPATPRVAVLSMVVNEQTPKHIRKVIAAVAAQYWRMELDRLRAEFDADPEKQSPELHPDCGWTGPITDAIFAERAWLRWGGLQ